MKGKASILIVDDDEDICKTLRLILEGEGYTVDVAHSGKEAIEKSKVKAYNIALLDIVLPDMQGTQLLKKLRETTPKMVKIMVTGHPNLENAVEAPKPWRRRVPDKACELRELNQGRGRKACKAKRRGSHHS